MAEVPAQTPLVTQFLAAVNEFNNCKAGGDYQNLAKYYDPSAQLQEVDPDQFGNLKTHSPRDGIGGVIDYLAKSQPALLPRFWPILPFTETYPTTTSATLDGSATYFDCTANPPPPDPPAPALPIETKAFTIKFHFEFKLTGTTWLVTNGWGKKT